MKKLTFPAILLALSLHTAVAQTTPRTPDNSGVQTPNTITNRFNTDYPNTNATWTMDGSNYRAEYTDSKTNVPHSITYDKNGGVINREERLSRGAYPGGIGDYYSKKYPNENYDVWSSTDASGNTTYYTTRNSEMLWFDKNGNCTKRSSARTNKSSKKGKQK